MVAFPRHQLGFPTSPLGGVTWSETGSGEGAGEAEVAGTNTMLILIPPSCSLEITIPTDNAMRQPVFILLGLALACNALAADVFRRPPGAGPPDDYTENPVYAVGQKVTFTWESDYREFDMLLWNDKLDANTGYHPYTRILRKSVTGRAGFV